MKRFLTFLALLLTLSVSAQTFQVATQIVASPDCKLKFLNKIDSQIYEVNSVDMTWQYLTTTTIKIKDYDNEVTVYKNNITSPVFANIPAFLDSVQGACLDSGGGGVQSIVAGTNVTVDNSDPQNPIVSASGGSGSDSTIYKADGSTDELRTANFNDGLLLHNNSLNDYIILGNNSGYETGIYGNEGASSFAVRENTALVNGDTTIFLNYKPIGEGFDSLNVEFWHLQQKTNLPYILGVDTLGGDNYSLYRTSANFLPLTFSKNQIILADTFSFSIIGDSIGFHQNVSFNGFGFPTKFSGFTSPKGGQLSLSGQLLGTPEYPDVWIPAQVAITGNDPIGGDGQYTILAVSPGGISASGANNVNEWEFVANYENIVFSQNGNSIEITGNDMVVPKPPLSGNYVLKSVDGVVSWVAE